MREKMLISCLSLCADENKARVVALSKLGGGGILRFLEGGDDALLPFVISVIYNICVDNGGFCLFLSSCRGTCGC